MNVHNVLRTARLASWGYRILSTAVGLVTIRLIADRIGLDGYGQVAFALAIVTAIIGVDFGLLQAMSRFVAQYEDERHAAQRPMFWAACRLAALSLFVAQAAIATAVAALSGHIAMLQWGSPLELMTLALTMILANTQTLSSAFLAGHQLYGQAAAAKILRSLFYLVAIVTLWYADALSVRWALWSNALTFLLANAITTVVVLLRFGSHLIPSWQAFPGAQMTQLRAIGSYSLHGWLFSLSTLVVTSGSVIATGLVFPADDVARLQVGLMLYTGVAAFVTGGMSPLITIAARFADGSPVSRERIGTTARSLVDETIIFAATLTVFFVNFGDVVLALLLGGHDAHAAAIRQTHGIMLAAVLPGLVVLPAFTFRFALVSPRDNAAYSHKVFVGTLLVLGVGFAVAALTKQVLPLAGAVGAALAYRGTLAYRMGHQVLPGLTWPRLLRPLVLAGGACEAFALLASLPRPGWRVGDFGDGHLHAALYLVAAAGLYVNRQRMRHLLGLRLPRAGPQGSS